MLKTIAMGILSWILVLPLSLNAQAENKYPLLDSLEQVLDANNQVKGSYCIYAEGKVVAEGSFGGPHGPWKYRVGSISKTFTAMLMLLAEDESKIKLDDTLSSWFPSIKNADRISLRMLLNHSSGIHNFTNDASFGQIMQTKQSRSAMIARFAAMESDFEPGTDFGYSNTNFVLASYILEDLYQKPIGDLLLEKLNPLAEIDGTYFFDESKKSESEVSSYFYTNEWVEMPATHPSIPLGAGGIVSSPLELCKFMRSIHVGNTTSEENKTRIQAIENYDFGIMTFPFFDKRAFGHNGGIDGFQSHASYFPQEDLAIAICLNGSQYPLNDLSLDLLSIYFGKEDYKLPEFKNISLSEAELRSYIGLYKSDNFPLDISIEVKEGELFGQASGQPSFPLSASDKNVFEFKAAGIRMEFKPEDNIMNFEQGGAKIQFKR